MSVRSRHKRPTFFCFVVFLLAFTFALSSFLNTGDRVETVTQSDVIAQYNSGLIQKVVLTGNTLELTLKNGIVENAIIERNTTLADLGFDSSVVDIEVQDEAKNQFWLDLLIGSVPFVIIGLFLLFMLRSAQGSNNSAMSFGKSRAKLYDSAKKKVNFSDVAGSTEAKGELEEIVDFLKAPMKYNKMGAKIPRGVMLFGSPGTGKTLLARAVAGEANVPFFSISGSEFVEMFVGVGASRVRDLFSKAKKNAPSIIFVDEIDAVGRQRGTGLGGGHDEREQTLNQILTEMDGFDNDTGVIVIAATNRPDVLDPALLRPGRFDRRIVVDMPNQEAREEILEVHGRNKPLAKDVDLTHISRFTIGFSGADLENLMNEAAIMSAKVGAKKIDAKTLDSAIEKVMMGPEMRSRQLNDEELKITAYHECGHALVGTKLKNCDPAQKVSIVSRGHALGVTWFLPQEDEHLRSRDRFIDDMASMLGGYAAEKLFFGQVTTGPSNDLERATKMARTMILKYGMSDRLGPVVYGGGDHAVFLGKELGEGRDYSDETARVIDQEVDRFVGQALKTATNLIKENKNKVKKSAETLLDKEVLTGDQFRKLVA